jgi:Ni/Co efflux regulator RcnB
MKKILTAAMALSLLAGAGAASAQPHNDRNNGPAQRADQRNDHGNNNNNNNNSNNNNGGYERRADKRYKANRYQPPRGYQARAWRHGDKLPPAYRGKSYVVDYRTYHLAPPPRGYQYVRVNNDVVLTAIASGVIASVITQLFQ